MVFAFERYNGLLGRYHTNNQTIEVQLIRKFLCEQQTSSIEIPAEASDVFDILHTESFGSLQESCNDFSNEGILQLKEVIS